MIVHPTDEALFWSRTRRNVVNGCLEWIGPLDWDGYGLSAMRHGNSGRMFRAHRVAWHLRHGSPAGKMYVCHRCDNPPCVDPEHLFLGTPKDNFRDCLAKGRYSPKGTGNAAAKLTPEDVLMIRALYARDGRSQQAIANDFNITQTAVSAIVRGKTWAHVRAA